MRKSRAYIPLDVRFWKKVHKTDTCWLWAGATSHYGHGTISSGGKVGESINLYAHRVSWELANGPIPTGLYVLHKCDVPGCVNPAHLFLGTKLDNSRDMVSKMRHRVSERHPRAKLTNEQATEIRAGNETQSALAARFGVSQSAISLVRRGINFRYLTT